MGKIMKDGIQYGVGGITDASDIKYGSTDVESALNDLNNGLTNKLTAFANAKMQTFVASWSSLPTGDTNTNINISSMGLTRISFVSVQAIAYVSPQAVDAIVLGYNTSSVAIRVRNNLSDALSNIEIKVLVIGV